MTNNVNKTDDGDNKWLYVATLTLIQLWVLFITQPGLLTTIGSIAGVLCVTTLVFRDYKTFLFGAVANISFLIIGIQNGVYSELIQQPMFLILGALGYMNWKYGYENKVINLFKNITPKKAAGIAGIAIILWSIISYLLGSSVYIYDGLLCGTAIASQALEIDKSKYSWIGWMLLNVLSIITWAKVGNTAMAFVYVVYLINSTKGFIKYSRK